MRKQQRYTRERALQLAQQAAKAIGEWGSSYDVSASSRPVPRELMTAEMIYREAAGYIVGAPAHWYQWLREAAEEIAA